jgi:hypothetical protein
MLHTTPHPRPLPATRKGAWREGSEEHRSVPKGKMLYAMPMSVNAKSLPLQSNGASIALASA